LLLIEVKKGYGGEAAIKQLVAYGRGLKRRPEYSGMRVISVLLSVTTECVSTDAAEIRDYAKFTRNLRRLALAWKKRWPLEAAATLMLAGAIELNLLGLGGQKAKMAHHVRRFVEFPEYEDWRG
jgi:hypothetical protein